MMPDTDRSEEDTAAGRVRVHAGFLNLRTEKKIKKRWVVFQGDESSGIFQLKVFKNSNERVLKCSYTVTKDTFVGTERGERQVSKQSQKTRQTENYLAFLLVTVTFIFEENASNLEIWHSAIKKYFDSHSWDVVPSTGVGLPQTPVVLHITQKALSLATTNPPQHYQRWDLRRVADFGVWGARVYMHFDSSKNNRGYFEMRAATPDEANSIGDTLTRLLPHLGSRTETKAPPSQLVPAKLTAPPVSPRRSKPDHPDITASGEREKANDDQTVFKFPSSSPPLPPSSTLPSGPPPPPVSPRPPSSLISPSSLSSPPTLHSPLTLALKPPPIKRESPSNPN